LNSTAILSAGGHSRSVGYGCPGRTSVHHRSSLRADWAV